jgi:hypothetical protein
MLRDVLDVDTLTDGPSGPGTARALVTAVSLCQHGDTFDDAATDEGDGTVLASFLSLAIATARTIGAEDDAIDTAGRPERNGEPWRLYVERCGRIALVRSLRAAHRATAGPSGRDSLYRVPAADDPSVTAPRAPRASRSPGSRVANVPKSRSERRRDAIARAAAVTVDALGGTLPRLVTFGQTLAGDPHCPLALVDPEEGETRHACTPACFGLGGMHAYSPRQGRAHATLPAGTAGPVLTDDQGVSLVWRPFRTFPEGVAYRRGHDVDTAAADLPDKAHVRLVWRPGTARQYVTDQGRRFTPGTFKRADAASLVIPDKTAAHLAAGGTFDPQCVTVYDGRTFVGHGPATLPDAVTEVRATRKATVRRARATLTTQQRAMVTLVTDAVTLVMYDGRARTAHTDAQGRGYVVTRTTDGVLSLVTPDGITTPVPTDPRKQAAAIRAAILLPGGGQ